MRTLARWAKPVACSSAILLLPDVIWQRRFLTVPTAIYAVFFGALVIMAINGKSSYVVRFWNSRILRMLGRYSYGMYVFQNPLIPLLSVLFTAETLAIAVGSPLWGRLIYIALMSGITLIVAIGSWHLYEKHFLKLKARF
jgi:peptidoglycan/LPS O-acetylase OafA/YrhL